MFRSRRSLLVKRLWKYRVHNETGSPTESAEELELKSVAHSMLKRLKEKQLEALAQSIESQGGELTECVMLPKGEQRLGRKTVMPQVLCCKLWRWMDITNFTELKRLPCCSSRDDPIYECCNPYHWSLVSRPDVQISTFDWAELEKVRDLGLSSHSPEETEPVSMETGMTPTSRRDCQYDNSVGAEQDTSQTATMGPHWCSLAYWEKRDRVGRLLKVYDSSIDIFQDLPHGNGLCLRVLQENSERQREHTDGCTGKRDSKENSETDAYVKRTRDKIGFGIILSQESDGVWVYNRSQYPIFVNSPTLEIPNTRTLFVHKCQPGYSLKIFDYERAHLMEEIRDPKYLDGPYDPSSIRISFAKGWGPHYSRQFMTSCPCWIEVLLNLTNLTR